MAEREGCGDVEERQTEIAVAEEGDGRHKEGNDRLRIRKANAISEEAETRRQRKGRRQQRIVSSIFSAKRLHFPQFACLLASLFCVYTTSALSLPEGGRHYNDDKKEGSLMSGLRSKLVTVSSSSDSSLPAYPINSLSTSILKLGSRDDEVRNSRLSNRIPLDKSMDTLSAVFPLYGSVYPSGVYFVSVRFGNPMQQYFLDMDTGSELTWLQCDAPCIQCAKGPHPWYNPRQANLVDCSEASCSTIQVGSRFGCDKGSGQCDYDIQYADGGTSLGVLVRDHLALFLSNRTWGRTQAIIGCAYNQQGSLAHSPSMTDGVLGLSSSSISLPSQLSQKGLMRNVIAHCIPGDGAEGGYLLMGDKLLPSKGITWASLIGKPARKNYALSVTAVFYGDVQVDTSINGLGAAIFDSGTSYTYLIPLLYDAILASIQKHLIGSELQLNKSDNTLPICWQASTPIRSLKDVLHAFKPLILEFGDSRMELPAQGYLIVSSFGNVCLGLLDARVMGKDASNIIGDISMQDTLVVYDNENHRLGWKRTDCRKIPKTPEDLSQNCF